MARYIGLMAIAMAEFHTMPLEQRIGAQRMMALLSSELHHMHIDEKLRLNVRSLISTLETIQGNLLEDILLD